MKFYSFSIDPTVIVALITSITSLYLALKGKEQRKKKRKEDDNG